MILENHNMVCNMEVLGYTRGKSIYLHLGVGRGHLHEFETRIVVMRRRLIRPEVPNRFLKMVRSVSPSSPLKVSSSKSMSHFVNNARARACNYF